MRKGAIIHCSDSPQGRGDTAKTIHSWHRQRGWDGIGYHFVILEDGTIENGRPTYWKGAHAKGYNDFLGICLVGDGSYTAEQFTSLAGLLTDLHVKGLIEADKVLGHYQVSSNKICPCFNVSKFITKWLNGEFK